MPTRILLYWSLLLLFGCLLAWIIYQANTGQAHQYWGFVHQIPAGDKLGHFGLMGILSMLVNLVSTTRQYRLGRFHILQGSIWVIAFVAIEECSQIFLSHRTFSLMDLGADLAGIWAGAWVALRLKGKCGPAPS